MRLRTWQGHELLTSVWRKELSLLLSCLIVCVVLEEVVVYSFTSIYTLKSMHPVWKKKYMMYNSILFHFFYKTDFSLCLKRSRSCRESLVWQSWQLPTSEGNVTKIHTPEVLPSRLCPLTNAAANICHSPSSQFLIRSISVIQLPSATQKTDWL